MALVKINGLVQGEHTHPAAAPRANAIDSANITYTKEGVPTYAKVVIEETDNDGKVVGFFPVTARDEAAVALAATQWQRVELMAQAYKTRSGDWVLNVISVKPEA
jgi:hypothetical protein